jgi:hypothetical protein
MSVNEAIDICHAKGLTSIMALNYDWNEEVIAQFYANLYVRRETKTFLLALARQAPLHAL